MRIALFPVVVTALLGCRDHRPVSVERPTHDTIPSTPGFVLYTKDATIVIADDGTVTSAPGLWVLDDGVDPPTVTEIAWRPTAPVMELPVPPPEEVDGEEFDPCWTDGELELASLVGGQLYALGWSWNGACYMSLSLYDSLSESTPVVVNPVEPNLDALELRGCDGDHPPAHVVPAWPLPMPGTDECPDDFEPEAEVLILRRGDLWLIEDNIHHAGGTRRVSHVPARPDNCPSANDPCGDPTNFPSIDDYPEFWIHTNGRIALGAVDTRYTLFHVGGPSMHPFDLGTNARHEIIGVRIHDDVAPLRRAIQPSLQTPAVSSPAGA